MTIIEAKIIVDEYFIKEAKPISKASQIYLNKKYIGEYMALIPLNENSKCSIKEIDELFEINVKVDCIFKKEAKKRGRGAYCYLPSEFADNKILIFKSPDYWLFYFLIINDNI